MGRLVGYARVGTGEQDLQLQLDALKAAGCDEVDIYTDKASGARGSRPGLDACIATLEPGDTLIVWRLDRLGRSMPHLVTLVDELLERGSASDRSRMVLLTLLWRRPCENWRSFWSVRREPLCGTHWRYTACTSGS